MEPAFRARLEAVYRAHPLTAASVLARVRQHRGHLPALTEHDLAYAPDGGPTDQNHVGGAAGTLTMARALGLDGTWRVLDVGSGLGGTPRLLAASFGCRCHGVELTDTRFADAVELTRLTALDDLVSFTHGDFLEVALPGGPFDLVLFQGAVLHFRDLPACLRRAASVLRAGGRLVAEDPFLARPPANDDEAAALRRLEQHWNVSFVTLDDWERHAAAAGFHMDVPVDLSALAMEELDALIATASSGRLGSVTPDEHEGWKLGHRFLHSGVLRYARIVTT